MRDDDEAWTEIVDGWEGQNRKQTISEKREGVYFILMLLLQHLSASSKYFLGFSRVVTLISLLAVLK